MLPILYHAHHQNYKEDIPFWIELAAQQGGPILEMGCGTGRVLGRLAQAGHEMFGLDKDPGMLAFLQANLAPGLREHTFIFSGDFTSFRLDLNFPLIIMPCNTYSTLSIRERRETLERARQHLCPEGVFVASLPNPDLLRKLPSRSDPEIEDSFPHPLDGEPVQVSSAWMRTPGGITVHWYYDHLSPDGGVERFSTQVHHNLVPLQTYKAEIRGAGLQVVNIFGDFKKDPFTSDSPFLVLVIERPRR